MKTCNPIRAFTLIEMLVVMTILTFLIALLIPVIQSAKERGRRTECASNMRQIGLAFVMYQNDHAGRYPPTYIDASKNWQAYLGDPIEQGSYLPAGWITYDAGNGAKRIKAEFLCRNMVQKFKISGNHTHWGYCLNHARTGISYQGAAEAPWYMPQYRDVDATALYSKPAKYAVMTDGDGTSLSIDTDWDATISLANPVIDWPVAPVHGDVVNVVFMDAHMEVMKLDSPAAKEKFNRAWYGGIPSGLVNPYLNAE